MGCTDQCKENRRKHEKAEAEYFFQWPHHCKKCDGWGGFYSSYDPSPAGVSLGSGSMQDYDPCPACYDQGVCPRCGREFDVEEVEDNDLPCPHCGITFDGSTDGLPGVFECWCDFVQESITDLYEEK